MKHKEKKTKKARGEGRGGGRQAKETQEEQQREPVQQMSCGHFAGILQYARWLFCSPYLRCVLLFFSVHLFFVLLFFFFVFFLLQLRTFEVQLAEKFVYDPSARVLLVVNSQTTADEVDAWRRLTAGVLNVNRPALAPAVGALMATPFLLLLFRFFFRP